jgi:hypothetical protein
MSDFDSDSYGSDEDYCGAGRIAQRNISRLTILFTHPITKFQHTIKPESISGYLCYIIDTNPNENHFDSDFVNLVPTSKSLIERYLSKMFAIFPSNPEYSRVSDIADRISCVNYRWHRHYKIQNEHQGGDHL